VTTTNLILYSQSVCPSDWSVEWLVSGQRRKVDKVAPRHIFIVGYFAILLRTPSVLFFYSHVCLSVCFCVLLSGQLTGRWSLSGQRHTMDTAAPRCIASCYCRSVSDILPSCYEHQVFCFFYICPHVSLRLSVCLAGWPVASLWSACHLADWSAVLTVPPPTTWC